MQVLVRRTLLLDASRTLLVAVFFATGSPLLASSVPILTLTELDYHIPTLNQNPFGQGTLYNAGIDSSLIISDFTSTGSPYSAPIFWPVSKGPFGGPLPIPGSGAFDSVTGQLAGFLIGMPGTLFSFDVGGSGQLTFAPVALPARVGNSFSVSEPAVGTGVYTASCVSTSMGSCPSPPLLANLSLGIAGTINIGLQADVPDNAFLISATFTGTTVVPEPRSAWLVTFAVAAMGILFRYRKFAQ